MTTIHELVKAYAAKKADIEHYDDMGMDSLIDDAEAEAERIMQQIESYYQPRPEGSIVAKRDEYDTLTEIAMLIYHFQNDLLGAIPDAELVKLKTWLAKWYEMLPESE